MHSTVSLKLTSARGKVLWIRLRDSSVPINGARSRGNLQLVLASHLLQELAVKAELKIPEGPWPVFQVWV